jgi:cell division protein ZapE
MSGPVQEYARRIASGDIAEDRDQVAVVDELDRLHRELKSSSVPLRGWRRRIARLTSRRITPVRGIYLWGSVGRGKTFLMDLFYNSLPVDDKMRRHFHRFMADVHQNLRQLRDRPDPLELVADRLADRTRIICFDEFAVSDIADAMILGNLFSALFERGVSLAATSNDKPNNLYKDGLQRQRFLHTIELLQTHTRVLQIGGKLDYRLQYLEHADVYKQVADIDTEGNLARSFVAIAPDRGERNGSIEILGRAIDYQRRSDGVVWFRFGDICDGPRSQDDYIELSRVFQTVLISNVPQFTRSLENQARRFIALVDEFYDRKVKLILSAEVQIDDLYAGEKLAREFERTKSRLREMQSHAYLAAAHRP